MVRLWTGCLILGALAAVGCSRSQPMITSFDAEPGLSVGYPASWTTERAREAGVSYRYFLSPPQHKPAVSVTLLVGSLGGGLDQYAQLYLKGNRLSHEESESRQGTEGRSYRFSSADGATRYALLLLGEESKVFGLYAQAAAPDFERHTASIEDIFDSLTFERAAHYTEYRDEDFGFSLRVPPSWRSSRSFSGSDRLLRQYTSPPLAADSGGETVHASLALTVEPIEGSGDLEAFYQAIQERLGESFQVLSHEPWRGGFRDLLHAETPVAASRENRYYLASEGRGYSLSCATRGDAFHHATRWCDLIASTLRVGAPR